MILNPIARLVAIILSLASGAISVIGLSAIFSGAYWAVIAVASILEVAKVITAAWLDRNWRSIGWKLKTYLSSAVVVLMLITSLGIYGFFARAHIEQQVQQNIGEKSKIPLIDAKIKTEEEKLADLDKQISQIDTALSTLATKGKAKDAKSALDEAPRQRKARDDLNAKKDKINEVIVTLKTEKIALENNVKKNEVETGPLKYLANLYYSQASETEIENAIRLLILTLVLVFDPLAIALLIASNHRSYAAQNAVFIASPTDPPSETPKPSVPTRLSRPFGRPPGRPKKQESVKSNSRVVKKNKKKGRFLNLDDIRL